MLSCLFKYAVLCSVVISYSLYSYFRHLSAKGALVHVYVFSLNDTSSILHIIPKSQTFQPSHIKNNNKMLTVNFPTTRFGAGPGTRSNSCHTCMTDIDPKVPSGTHTTCQHTFYITCLENWAEAQFNVRLPPAQCAEPYSTGQPTLPVSSFR
jgi:hypothetical protein